MRNKGQLSIEFILIVVVILILLQTIVIPFSDSAKDSISDISSLAYIDGSAKNLKEAIEYVSLSESIAKTQIIVFIPEDANITILQDSLTYKITLKDPPQNAYCSADGLCIKSFDLSGLANTDGMTLLGKKEYLVSIFKEQDGKTYAEVIE